MSDHHHDEYAEARHDHRGDYADERHDHDLDYAEKHHRHYDERAVDELQRELGEIRAALAEYERDLAEARGRIRQLEEHFPDVSHEDAAPLAAVPDRRPGRGRGVVPGGSASASCAASAR